MITNVLEYLEGAGKRYPDKILFSDPAKEISYQEFITAAKRIGSRLVKYGAVQKPAAVFIDRDVESLEAFMGIVYSGNFYVPIDRKLPLERIRKILEGLTPFCILGKKEDAALLESLEYGQRAFHDYEELLEEEICQEALDEIRSRHIDTAPLYAVYTSGSTGVPKGVLVCHRSVIDLIEQFYQVFSFDEREVFANQAPFDFDVSVKDIYSTLKCGGTMHILPQKMFSFPKELIPYLTKKKATVLIWAVSALAVTAAFKGLDKEVPKYLKKIMFSGEVMPVKVLNYWREHLPKAMYVNLYGPTEITCNCTYYIVDREFSLEERLPIGKAFPNTEVFLLNEKNEKAAPGETGEICVRGTSLALGYYRNGEATQKAFCQNPLNSDYPELIYRTGDLGKEIEGELYFSSRKDFQIKHMGHRIELGEIEGVLDGLAYLERSCCIYDEKRKKIVMFYQAEENLDKRIIGELQRFLPKYMCPNKYVFLPKLPLNKNGKIDRKRLKEQYLQEK